MAELLRVNEAAAQLRISRARVYELISQQKLASFKLDGRRLISQQAVDDLIAYLEADAKALTTAKPP